MSTRRRAALGGLLAAALLVSGCSNGGGSGSGGDAQHPAASLAGGTATPSAGAASPGTQSGTHASSAASRVPRPPARRVTKLLVLVVENHSLRQMRTGMPWTFRLAHRYGYATRYHAITHPSLPNYLAIAGGSTFGVRDDNNPVAHQLSGRSVFGQALNRGKTAKAYAEGMPSPCSLTNNGPGRYAVRHNPWTYFTDERGSCNKHDVPFTALAGDVKDGALPNAGFVAPDLCHDAHDCSLSVADDWMRSTIRTVMDGPDWASGHLAVVVTADEDDRHSGNRVLTVVVHPSQRGHVVRKPLTHYSLTRLYDQVIGAKPLRKAKKATSMANAFGLPMPKS